MPKVTLGLEVLYNTDQYDDLLEGKRLALITNPTGVDSNFKSAIDLLNEKYDLTALFSPEHGVRGDAQAGDHIDTYTDPITNLPVYSLYRKGSQNFTQEMLDEFDVLVYDLQDVGCRYYTYPYSLLNAMKDCAANGKTVVILDRPNPLGGVEVEGSILEEEFLSFVGGYQMPVKYALTIGEFATMAKDELSIDVDLHVVKMEGWERDMLWPDTGLPWVSPSPNIPNFEIAYLYPGTCLFEGTGLSEGRGTTLPFKQIGASFIQDPDRVVEALNARNIPGVRFRPAYFTPNISKEIGKLCGGVELYIEDFSKFKAVRTGVEMIYTLKELYPDDFEFRSVLPPATNHFINLLSGNDKIYNQVDINEIYILYDEDEEKFKEKKIKYHLY